ncbi:type VI secretion system Vgr family protein [Paraburkholderia dinghuensis]|uniref:Type VI secretion system tip protein VgrG n=1 Tax=Paraburkholderia dinghuensis TaxID=2305225 RepID=A0A3N6PKB4_9BURK|nr:type VI secretion system Vgr family protein [Paraburkholderia dinghuensis]RQH01680.1 type VI secretion system tip protein VgrG [Paraburkholderia dinghuensis]
MDMTELAQAIRGGLIQQDRLLKTDIPALPGNALIPRRAVTHAELGRDFSVELDMVSAAGDIELKTLIAQPITLWIQQAGKSYLPINGYIHTAHRLGADGSLTGYQLSFASWMYFLKFRSDMRLWQDKSVVQIVTDVFNQHPQAQGHFQFALFKPLPTRSYCRQSETDWNFVHRLLESEGLFGFWQQAEDGRSHTFVITDDLYKLNKMSPETVDFYRSGATSEVDAFTQWSASRTLQSVTYTTRTFDYKAPASLFNPKGTTLPTRPNQGELPGQLEIYSYTGAYTYSDRDRGDHLTHIHLEEWESRAKRFHGAGGVRGIDAGLRFSLNNHPEHQHDPANQREFAAIKVSRYIENNLPPSSHETNFPHSLKSRIAEAQNGYSGDTLLKIYHADGSEGFFLVEVEAQRITVPYRSPFEHKKPEMHLETAMVVGPKGEEVYTDALNRIKVRFIWERINPGDQNASCWVRVAQSDTGGGYGGVHVPRVGEEVIIGHIGGDCDRPIVLHRVFNGAVQPQWHSNGILSGYRTKEYSGAGFNELALDDATGQNRVRLMSSTGNSLLHLGYLIDQSGNTRGSFLGSGFDLKSDAYGAVRAGQGLYISTHSTSVAQPLGAQPATEQLINAGSVIEAVSEASVAGHAESLKAGQEALTKFANATQHSISGAEGAGGRTAGGGAGNANGFSKPVMLMASPSGIALSTPGSTHISADQHINLISGKDTYLATGKSLVMSVVEKISLFVQKTGIKMFASAGKIDIQAQNDEMALSALKNLTVRSTDAQLALSAAKDVKLNSVQSQITIAAKQGITLTSGGAYVKIADGNIELGCPGSITLKSGNFHWEGPASVTDSANLWPGQIPANFSAKVIVDQQLQERLGATGAIPYQFISESGAVIAKGTIDETGATQRIFHPNTEGMDVLFGEKGEWSMAEHPDGDSCECGVDHAAQSSPGFAQLAGQAQQDGNERVDEERSLQSTFDSAMVTSVDSETIQFQRSLIEQLVFKDPKIEQAILDGED